MKKLLTICVVGGLIMAVAGTAQGTPPSGLDIDGIYIASCNDFRDGTPETNPWDFEIWVDFDGTGDLDHIDVNLPIGATPSFITIDEDDDWEYESTDYSTLTALQGNYPTGDYTFEFFDSVGTLLDSVTLDYSGLSEPLNPVDFIYPSTNGQTIGTNPTFRWDVNSNDGDALGMWVLGSDDDDKDVYEDVPVSMDTLDWTPGSLDPNDYELEVSVFEVKNPQQGPALPTMMTTGDDEFEYGLLIEYINTIEFTTIPEPATIALLGFGSLLLSRNRRFNKK